MVGSDCLQTWRPRVAGVAEVLHAEWRDHAYPAHTHDTWTLLIVDDGLIGYGHAASTSGFRKRVVYLDETAPG